MTNRPVPRLVRAIAAAAALIVAGIGPVIALATAWRVAEVTWTEGARSHAVPAPRHVAVAVAHLHRRGRSVRNGDPHRGGGSRLRGGAGFLGAQPETLVAAVVRVQHRDARPATTPLARSVGQAHPTRAPPGQAAPPIG